MRINLFAGPGAGKSTLAAGVYSALKQQGVYVELVREYVKSWAYSRWVPSQWDQIYIFGKQLHAESQLLERGVEVIVTDSPILLNVFYTQPPLRQPLYEIAQEFERRWPSVNFWVDRKDRPYMAGGRYQTESEARILDQQLRRFLDLKQVQYEVVSHDDVDRVVTTVLGVQV
jgi:hypothetical protein